MNNITNQVTTKRAESPLINSVWQRHAKRNNKLFQKSEILNRKGRKVFTQRTQSFDLKHFFFAPFAKNLSVLCVKKYFLNLKISSQ